MRILFVNNFSKGIGGGEVQLLTLMRGLKEKGVEVRLQCEKDSELARRAKDDGIDVHEIHFALHRLIFKGCNVKQLGKDCDVVVGTGYFTNLLVAIGVLPKKVKRVALHAVMPDAAANDLNNSLKGGLRKFFEKSFRSKTDKHIAITQAVKEGIIKEGVPEEKIIVIPLGVELPAAGIIRKPFAQEGIRLGFMGRLEEVKGCDLLIRSLALLQDIRNDFRLEIAGAGTQLAELEQLVSDLQLDEICNFAGWQDSHDYLSRIDILCIPSRSEAASIAALEAQRAGVAVLAFDVGGISEILLSNKTTKLVLAGDKAAFANALSKMMDTLPQMQDELVVNAEYARKVFLPKTMISSYLSLFQELCN